MADVGAPDLLALRAKYERILVLRQLHARARSDASFTEPDPRPEMRALARVWPGSLRELDDLEMAEVVARIEALDRALRDATRAEGWMVAQDAFHRLARGALAAKRWLAGRKELTGDVRAAFAAWARGREAELWGEELDAIAVPPRGRVMDVVHARVGRELGVSAEEARRLTFGGARASRRRG